MISLIHQGIIAAAGGLAQTFQLIPSPLFLDGQWWSFIDQDSGSTSAPSPVVSSRSASATDISSFTVENVTTGASNGGGITAIGNGKVLRQFSTNLLVKDLTTPTSNWDSYNLSVIPGGHIGGGSPVISYAPGPGLFILHKSGKDLYSSPDAVTWTAYDPVTDNQLSTLMDSPKIFHNGSTYVAIGHPTGDTSQLIFATSSDLSTWTSAGSPHAVTDALFIRFFEYKGKFFYIPISAALPVIHSSTDLITWTPLYTPTTNVSLLSSRPLVTSGRLSFLGSKEIYTDDGLTFNERLPVINFRAVFSEEPYSSLTGAPLIGNNGITSYPAFLAFRQNESTKNGGRLYSVNPLTFSPTLEIPADADYGNIVGLCGLVGNSIIGPDNFTVGGDLKYGYYAKNSSHGNTYFEIKVISKTTDDGEFGLDAVYFTNNYQPAGKKVGAYLRMNGDLAIYNETLSTVTLSNITTPLVAEDIIGFLFNGVSETLEIHRNGALLATVTDLATSAYSFSQRLDGSGCRLKLNLGQELFSYPAANSQHWGSVEDLSVASFTADYESGSEVVTKTYPAPSGIIPGNTMIAILMGRGPDQTTALTGGWTYLGRYAGLAPGETFEQYFEVFYKTATNAEPGVYQHSNGLADRKSGVIVQLSRQCHIRDIRLYESGTEPIILPFQPAGFKLGSFITLDGSHTVSLDPSVTAIGPVTGTSLRQTAFTLFDEAPSLSFEYVGPQSAYDPILATIILDLI